MKMAMKASMKATVMNFKAVMKTSKPKMKKAMKAMKTAKKPKMKTVMNFKTAKTKKAMKPAKKKKAMKTAKPKMKKGRYYPWMLIPVGGGLETVLIHSIHGSVWSRWHGDWFQWDKMKNGWQRKVQKWMFDHDCNICSKCANAVDVEDEEDGEDE